MGRLKVSLSECISFVLQLLYWPLSTMPTIVSAINIPCLLLLSIPLAAFAVFTTTVAFWVLLFRVSLVYAELLMALLRSSVASPLQEPTTEIRSSSPGKDQSPRSRRASQSSSGSSGLQMHKLGPNDSSATLAGPLPTRDYEGVGGWLVQDDDEEEGLWLGINPYLEPPSVSLHGHHQLSQTSLNRAHSGFASPELVRTPLVTRIPGWSRAAGSGTASPEGYFTTALKAPINGFDRTSKVSFENQDTGASTASSSSVKITRQDPT